MKILVTGAAGFIGERLIRRLVSLGYKIVVIDRNAKPIDLQNNENVTWIRKDIAVEVIHNNEINDIDTVIHLAGATLGAGEDEWRFLSSNESTTTRLLQVCSERINKFIYASTQCVYGDVNDTAVDEMFPLQPSSSAYACSKINSENWLKWFQKKNGGTYFSLRFSGFIEGGGIVDYIIDRALRNQPVELYSNGTICRDYLTLNNGVDVIISALNYKGDMGYLPINIGSGQQISSLELTNQICAELGSTSKIILTEKSAPQDNFVFDIHRAIELFNFAPDNLLGAVKNYATKRKVLFYRNETCA